MRWVAVSLAILYATVLPSIAWAHHSGAMFDRERTLSVSGIVREFNWTNPHASFKVEVMSPGGAPVVWAVEMNGPNNLVHEGWRRTSIKPGDSVTVLVNPLRDGLPGGWYVSIRLADGTTLSSSGLSTEKNAADGITPPADGAGNAR